MCVCEYTYIYICMYMCSVYIYTYYLQIYLDIFIHITCKQWLLRIAPVVFRKVCSKSLLPCLRLWPIVTLLHIPLKLEKQQRSVPLFKISNWPSQPSRLQFPQLRGDFATQAVVEKGAEVLKAPQGLRQSGNFDTGPRILSHPITWLSWPKTWYPENQYVLFLQVKPLSGWGPFLDKPNY